MFNLTNSKFFESVEMFGVVQVKAKKQLVRGDLFCGIDFKENKKKRGQKDPRMVTIILILIFFCK